jgi:flagellar biogenesis protein FliO
MLIGISAILALAYGTMRLLMQKKKGTDKVRAPIDIVAQKRIGPRHQLVIVRAFGREHLLSIQGSNTTLIAANEEIEDNFGDKLALVSREEPSIEPQANMIQNVAITQKSEPTRETRTEPLTGGDLIRSAIQQRLSGPSRKNSNESESGAPGHKEEKVLSQAVAGLVRLRREAQL